MTNDEKWMNLAIKQAIKAEKEDNKEVGYVEEEKIKDLD